MLKSICNFLCAAAVALPLSVAAQQPVRTASGPVSGVLGADPSVVAYKGIPYAAPPIGELRWRAPKSPAPWAAVLKADQFSSSCIQNIVEERKPWTHEFMAHNKISEDCLYLNVWTPAKNANDKLPVYFWIHGGGYVEGSTAVPAYDGENLARRGVVVVTINYRLGLFGFLAHPELTKEAGHSSNYGSLDVVAALQWVRKNISSFGGDSNNITISGQSAGSKEVHNLVASPLAKGLFHRAIAESGSSYVIEPPMQRLGDAEKDGVKFAAAKGANTLKDLRSMTQDQLMSKISDGPAFSFRTVVDGYFRPAYPAEIYAQGKQNDVPELTGMVMDELSSTGDYGAIPMETYQKTRQQRYGDMAATFFKLYPNGTQEQSGDSQRAAFREGGLVSMFLWAEHREKTAKNKVFTYYWTHPSPGPDSARYGAFHTSEVPYVLNTLNRSNRPWTDQDRKITDMMGAYWVNFMKTGDPNGKGLPQWAPFTSKSAFTMELGHKTGMRPLTEKAKLEFWQNYLVLPGAVVR